MKVIIEGPSLTGKDIISHQLKDEFRLSYLGTSKQRIPDIKTIDEYSFLKGSIEATLKHINLLDNVITSKFFIDNVVSNIINNKCSLAEADNDFLSYLDKFHSTKNPILIILDSTYDTYLKRHNEDDRHYTKSPSIKEEMMFQHYKSLMNLYANRCQSKFILLRYSNYEETNLKNLIDLIISDLKKTII